MDNCSSSKLEDPTQKRKCLHMWPFIQATSKIPANTQDVSRMLKSLQPLLQDTLQKKRTTSFWESVYTVSGPLTWKDFHLLAGRGTLRTNLCIYDPRNMQFVHWFDPICLILKIASFYSRIILLYPTGSDEVSEPQPIPPLLAGYDKDWLSLSPYALRYWDKLLLEPYSKQHDVAYIVVAPDNDYILSAAQVFFKELSTVYELCRLGKHCPISRDLRDGIIRISKKAASKLSEEPVNEWFTFIGENIYLQYMYRKLAPGVVFL